MVKVAREQKVEAGRRNVVQGDYGCTQPVAVCREGWGRVEFGGSVLNTERDLCERGLC